MRWICPPKIFIFLFIGLVLWLFFSALQKYPGNALVYIAFTIISNTFLYTGFRRKAIFFEAFLSSFFWLGFWLKLSLRVAFFEANFGEAVGNFDGSGASFDRALLVVSCGFLGLLAASFLRGKFLPIYPKEKGEVAQGGFYFFYLKYRKQIIFLFLVLMIVVGVSNAYLGIYQKGSITRTTLPFGINGVYKWLLLFGLASISALIIRFEMELNDRNCWKVLILGLFECFISSVSQLSRGMILNAGALLYGTLTGIRMKILKIEWKSAIVVAVVFGALFAGSVLFVNYIRVHVFHDDEVSTQTVLKQTKNITAPLFIDRWVGMEGVLAVSSYSGLGWDLWGRAWKEVYNENKTSFYDENLIESPYLSSDKTKHHFISLPGIIAFFFYPGSFLFLFAAMFILGLIGALIELLAFGLGGRNVVLCSLFAQVVAYRYASFGYVPHQSYLLFGTIFLNLLLIFMADKCLGLFAKKHKFVDDKMK